MVTSVNSILRRYSSPIVGLAAIVGAQAGQATLVHRQPMVVTMLWYGTAVLLALAVFLPTKRSSAVGSFDIRVLRSATAPWDWLRCGLVAIALAMNVLALMQMKSWELPQNSLIIWLASMALLVIALTPWPRRLPFLRQAENQKPQDQKDGRPRLLEIQFAIVILLLGFMLRWYRLDAFPSGTHGDEGEMGLAALAILRGTGVEPFASGFFGPNLFYYFQAVALQWFGPDLAGLRTLTALFGGLTLVPFYLLVRMLFNWRVAAIAAFLLAVSNAHIHFSRLGLSNVPTVFFWVLVFYLIFLSLKQGRLLWSGLAGLVAGLNLYAYVGSRLLPFILAALFIFLLIARIRIWRTILAHAAIVLLGAWLVVSPLALFFVQYPEELTGRASMMTITNNEPELEARYGTTSTLPVLTGQALNTLSIFFNGSDISTFYDSGEPILPASVAALFLLGLCYAAMRTFNPRFFFLNLWFWSVFVAAGVMMIGTPYLPRLIELVPVLYVFPALVLDRLTQLIQRVGTQRVTLTAAAVLPLFLIGVGFGEWDSYFVRFAQKYPWPAGTTQANFVSSLGPSYHVYVIGTPYVFWEHGSTRFAARNITGQSLHNPPEILPLVGRLQKNVAFIVWPPLHDELTLLRYFYPSGWEQVVTSGAGEPVFTAYLVKQEDIQKTLGVQTSYYRGPEWEGPSIRDEVVPSPGFSPGPSSEGLMFPASGVWRGSLYVPSFGRYAVRLEATDVTQMTLDGTMVANIDRSTGSQQIELELARGLHPLEVRAVLPNAQSMLRVTWGRVGQPLRDLPREALLNKPISQGLMAEILRGDIDGQLLSRRFDTALAFRDVRGYAEQGDDFSIRWSGEVYISSPGPYVFEVLSDGHSIVTIDGIPILDNGPNAGVVPKAGSVSLTPGQHNMTVTYAYRGGQGLMELYWTPPGGQKSLVPPDVLVRPAGH